MFSFPLPFLGRPILWYGFFFALGFFLGYWILKFILKHYLADFFKKEEIASKSTYLAERMTFTAILGGVIGARIGDLLFYQPWVNYWNNPLAIISVWEGGLASHGGAIGIVLAMGILAKRIRKTYPWVSWLAILDLAVLPTPFVGGFIRIGNFFNQEILGTPTDLPWAVLFLHPIDASAPIPRHPVQLYESLFYFLFFFIFLYLFWNHAFFRKKGKALGTFLLIVFLFRFFIEFVKTEQSYLLGAHFPLTMGQLLSIPCILAGGWLLFRKSK